MRGKEELQVRNVFLKDLKLWLIASIQPHSPRIVSLSLPRCRLGGFCWHCVCPAFPPSSSRAAPAFSRAFPRARQLLWEEPRTKCWELLVSCKVAHKEQKILCFGCAVLLLRANCSCFWCSLFFPETSFPYPKDLAGKSNKVNSILVFCGVP